MTQSKHTPGPWDRCTMTASKIGVYTRDNRRKEPIAVFFMGETDEWKEFKNSKANADLIAAAPDMLAALENSLDRLETLLDADEATNADYECYEEVKAAIAKARGEA